MLLRWVVHYHARGVLDQVMRCCKDRNISIANLQITGSCVDGQSAYSALITLRGDASVNPKALLEHVRQMEGVISLDDLKG